MADSIGQLRRQGFVTSMHTTGLHRDWRTVDAFRRLRSDFDLVFLNRDIARDILGFSGTDAGLLRHVARLCSRTAPDGALGFVLLTLGAAGAALFKGSDPPILRPAPAVVTVDTTGAGDTFTGVFLATWLNDEPLGPALGLAVVAASHSVTAGGALGLHVTAQDLQRWSREVPEAPRRADRRRA
jgi:ribokinase